ncbi:GGDEF domain-containing protein [Pseudofrankia sp. DC12]|uniref:GGDEF domain-containing protein n=1 Tax=Pseudofrankia sp. DC12 TaxID=683315 RepID=UPI001E2B3881|nr:GGDEF domain-containing protein [Pseudofrankia sp. DC12]
MIVVAPRRSASFSQPSPSEPVCAPAGAASDPAAPLAPGFAGPGPDRAAAGAGGSPGPVRAPAPGLGNDWLWLGYLGAGAVAAVGYIEVPASGGWLVARMVAGCGIGVSSAVAVFAGLRRHQPEPRRPWLLIVLAQLLFTSASVVFYAAEFRSGDQWVLAVSMLLYLAHYPVLAAGLLLIVRRRAPRGELPALLDGLLVATGATTLSVLHLIGPGLDENIPRLVTWTAIGYPIADLLLFTIGVRLVAGTGFRPPAFILLSASLFAVLAADTGYGLRQLHAVYTVGGPLDGIWLAGSLALGAAALHPTMAGIAQPSSKPPGLGRARLCGLYLAGIIPPLTLVVPRGNTDEVTELVSAIAMVISTALIMIRMRYAEVSQRRLANTDVLTGLCTRRFLETRLALASVRASRPGATLALLLIDVDHFKSVNDRFGHPAGDRALTEVARRLRAVARSADVVARYGGEEFALLTTYLDQDDLYVLGERLRLAVAASPVAVDDGTALPVTVSVGAASTTLPASPAELVDRADRALYAAKSAGRDRCVLAAPAPQPDAGLAAAQPHCSPSAA